MSATGEHVASISSASEAGSWLEPVPLLERIGAFLWRAATGFGIFFWLAYLQLTDSAAPHPGVCGPF